jgi:hypothetical protein
MKYVNLDNLCILATEPDPVNNLFWSGAFTLDKEIQMYCGISPEFQRTGRDGTKYWLLEVICNGRQVFSITEENLPINSKPGEYCDLIWIVNIYQGKLHTIRGFLYGLICDQCDGTSYVLK